MENMNNEPSKTVAEYTPEKRGKGFTMFLGFAVITLFVAAIAIWFSINSTLDKITNQADKGSLSKAPVVPSEQQAEQTNGLIRLQALEGTVGQVGKPITFAVIADSNSKDIVGFDIALDYKEAQFEFQDAVANASGFNVAASTQKGVLAVSGYKSLGAKQSSVFSNTQIATITLIPKTTGSFSISPVASLNGASSKLVTTDKHVMVPRLESATVVVSN